MKSNGLAGKKRKIIDLTDDSFRSLSVLAAANGKNLKAYIESILDYEASMLAEEEVYFNLLKHPDSQTPVSAEEKESFEKWLGV